VADKPFLTDIQTLRERARQHIENGAVTEGYKADRETAVKILNETNRDMQIRSHSASFSYKANQISIPKVC
jgi:hypothetical protein